MGDLLRRHRLDVVRHTVKREAGGGYSVQAVADDAQVAALERAGYTVKRVENVDEAGRARQAEAAGGGNYMSVAAVEAALAALVQPANAAFVQLLSLPEPTWENRT
jgi:hypothetical protein